MLLSKGGLFGVILTHTCCKIFLQPIDLRTPDNRIRILRHMSSFTSRRIIAQVLHDRPHFKKYFSCSYHIYT